MNNITDWILSQMRLGDTEDEQEEPEQETVSVTNPDAQGMMNYICGGIYALDGDVSSVGENVFMATARKEVEKIIF